MKKSKTWFLFISLILLVSFRFFTSRPVYKNGDRVKISTTIYSDPIRYDFSQGIIVAGLIAYLPLYPEIYYGDKIIIEGTVNNGKLDDPIVLNKKENLGFFKLRGKIISFYESVLPSPESGLVAGITLGAKGALSRDFYDKTKYAGVAHIVVASGTNVTFVSAFLMGALTYLMSRKKAIAFVILGIILYLFVSGFDAPLVRASVMAAIMFTGQEIGRLTNPIRILTLTALIMLFIRPDWITDVGFALSFASTASLILLEPKIRKIIEFLPNFVKTDLSTTLAAQIGVTPILIVIFRQFNILSPLVNLFVLWTVPPVMILGFVGGIIGLIIPLVGKLVLLICFPLLWYFVTVVNLFNF